MIKNQVKVVYLCILVQNEYIFLLGWFPSYIFIIWNIIYESFVLNKTKLFRAIFFFELSPSVILQ